MFILKENFGIMGEKFTHKLLYVYGVGWMEVW